MDERGTSARPEPEGEDEHKVILNLLNSDAWQKRLEAARVEREKVLAERSRKAVVVPNPFGTGKPSRAGRLPPLEPAADLAEREAALRPVFTAKIHFEADSPRPADTTEAVALPAAPPDVEPDVPASTSTAVAIAPAAPPMPVVVAQQRPTRASVRIALGFALGVLAGLGAGVLPWLLRPADPAVPVATPQEAAPADATGGAKSDDAGVVPRASPAVPASDQTPAKTGATGQAGLGATDAAPDGITNITSISAQTRPPGPSVAAQTDPALAASAPPLAPQTADVSAGPAAMTPPADAGALLPVRSASPGNSATRSAPDQVAPDPALVAAALPAPPPALSDAAADPALPEIAVEPEARLPGGVAAPRSAALLAPPPAADADTAPSALALPPPPPALSGETGKVAIAAGHRVRVMAPKDMPDADLGKVTSTVAGAGFTVGDPLRVSYTIRADHVRYYHAADRDAAEVLAARIGGDARDFTGSDNQPPAGTIELWLHGSAPDEPKAAKAAPVKKKKKAVASAPKPAVPREDPQVRALRDRIVKQLQNGDHI